MNTLTDTTPARVIRTIRGRPTSDGAGVKLTRVIGGPDLPDLDPFLLLDEFGTDKAEDYLAGFPEHPHRGFETVTYMLDGRMRHKDNHGNEGVLVPGSVQWMTAGRGIVHSEMPEQQEGRMRGFQLWVNLPAREKMTAPKYQEFAPEFAFVVEHESTVCGYVLGALDSGAFYRTLAQNWFPVLRGLVIDPGADEGRWTGSDWVRRAIHQPELVFPPVLAPYPAHGHIDLLEVARGRGIGKALCRRVIMTARSLGCKSVWLGTEAQNTEGRALYRSLGGTETENLVIFEWAELK